MIEAELVWEIRALLGEGPIWWENALHWVDIEAPALHIYTPATGGKKSVHLREKTGTVVPRTSGGLILAQETGMIHFDPETGDAQSLPWPADKPVVHRFNDGKCDPQGRFWMGTMGREAPSGSLVVCRPGASGLPKTPCAL